MKILSNKEITIILKALKNAYGLTVFGCGRTREQMDIVNDELKEAYKLFEDDNEK